MNATHDAGHPVTGNAVDGAGVAAEPVKAPQPALVH